MLAGKLQGVVAGQESLLAAEEFRQQIADNPAAETAGD